MYTQDTNFFKTLEENKDTVRRMTEVQYTKIAGDTTKSSLVGMSLDEFAGFVRDELARTDAFNKFDSSRGSWESFLYGVIQGIRKNLVTAKAREVKHVIYTGSDMLSDMDSVQFANFDAEETSASTELSFETIKALEEILSTEELNTIKMIAEDGLTGREIGELTGKNEMAVSRMKKALKEKIGDPSKILHRESERFSPWAKVN